MDGPVGTPDRAWASDERRDSVCKGPLILGVNESDPPSCDAPVAGLVTLAPVTYLLGAAFVVLVVGVVHAGGKLRGQR